MQSLEDQYDFSSSQIYTENAETSTVSSIQDDRMTDASFGGKSKLSRLRTAASKRRAGAAATIRGDATAATSKSSFRPMTATTRAGYRSKSDDTYSNDPLNRIHKNKQQAKFVSRQNLDSPERLAEQMERKVHELLDTSALLASEKKFSKSLDKAKEAVHKEKALLEHCIKHEGLRDSQNDSTLSFAVLFHLALCYQNNGQVEEALKTYEFLRKSKSSKTSPQARNVSINIGNIYFQKQKFKSAIDMYRMALDQLPEEEQQMGYKISANIAKANVHLGKYREAIQTLETILNMSPNMENGFDLLACYFAVDHKDRMKQCFQQLITICHSPKSNYDDGGEIINEEEEEEEEKSIDDDLAKYMRDKQKHDESLLLKSARLISPVLDEQDWTTGFHWAIQELHSARLEGVSNQLQLDLSLEHMSRGDIDTALKLLKSFEAKGDKYKAMAASNLAFIHYHEGNYSEAEAYAKQGMIHSKYSPMSLVNMGNCHYQLRKDHTKAREMYAEALTVESHCAEALYNIGLLALESGEWDDAHAALKRVSTMVPGDPCVMYNLATIFRDADSEDDKSDIETAMGWFKMVQGHVPTDSGVLSQLSTLHDKVGDDAQSAYMKRESLRHNPVDTDILCWLARWFVQHEMLDQAIPFLERLVLLQPKVVQWKLTVCSCHRRLGNLSQAYDMYVAIHDDDDNDESVTMNEALLRPLIELSKHFKKPHQKYQEELDMVLNRIQDGSKMENQSKHLQV